MSLLEAGADLTGFTAEPTPEQKTILNQKGLRWVVAEGATDQCWLEDTLVGYVVGGNMKGEPCDAYIENPGADRVEATLVNTNESVERPQARLMLIGRVWDVFVAPTINLQVAS